METKELIVSVVGALLAGGLAWLSKAIWDRWQSRKIYNWLKENTSDERRHRSTKAIASHLHMTLDRVESLCSSHKKIYRSTGKADGMWSIYEREPAKPRGFFDLS